MTIDFKKYIPRFCEAELRDEAERYPILSVVGPRQSGKTRMIKENFSHLPYFDLGYQKVREDIAKDPGEFIRRYREGAVFDEFLYVPSLTEELRVFADELIFESDKSGNKALPTRFVLSSSHNYLMMDEVKESMVGRAGLIRMGTFMQCEVGLYDPYVLMFRGGYPAVHTKFKDVSPGKFFLNYIDYYLEKEVKGIHGIVDLDTFRDFLILCAGRVGSLVNFDTIAGILEISRDTVQKWLNILEISYIVFRSRPFANNIDNTVRQHPKLFFYDTGLAAYLLGFGDENELKGSSYVGPLFENLIMSDLQKRALAMKDAHKKPLFFKDKQGEIDGIIKKPTRLKLVEIKSADTFKPSWFENLDRFEQEKSPNIKRVEKYVVYTGPTQDVEGGRALNFADLHELMVFDA